MLFSASLSRLVLGMSLHVSENRSSTVWPLENVKFSYYFVEDMKLIKQT